MAEDKEIKKGEQIVIGSETAVLVADPIITKFGKISVLDWGDNLYLLMLNNTCMSVVDLHDSLNVSNSPYIEQASMILADYIKACGNDNITVLHLGLGAGTFLRYIHDKYFNVSQVVIEINDAIIDIAYRYFNMPKSKNIDIRVNDALNEIKTIKHSSVDFIFFDIYDRDGDFSDEFFSDEFLSDVKFILKDGGIIVYNICNEKRKNQLKRISNNLSDQFKTKSSIIEFQQLKFADDSKKDIPNILLLVKKIDC